MTKKELYNFLMPVVSRWRWLLNRVFSIFNSILSNIYTMNSDPLTTVAICSIESLRRVEFLKINQIHKKIKVLLLFVVGCFFLLKKKTFKICSFFFLEIKNSYSFLWALNYIWIFWQIVCMRFFASKFFEYFHCC